MKRLLFVSVLAGFALVTATGPAMAGEWELRFRMVSVSPNDDSDEIGGTGSTVDVDSDIVPEVDVTYMFNERWGLELIAATSSHNLRASGGTLAGANLGEVAVLPPTLTAQYHFGRDKKADFYLGLGINSTIFYNYDLSSDLATMGVETIKFDSSWGLAAQGGIDIGFGSSKWVWNIDVKYIQISTDADIRLVGGGSLDIVGVDIDPWVFGTGVGYRF